MTISIIVIQQLICSFSFDQDCFICVIFLYQFIYK